MVFSSNTLLAQNYNSQKSNLGVGINSQHIQNWVRVDSGNELYFNLIYPQANKPTVILLNGLTATIENWETIAQSLAQKGIGVLRFDFYGQGKTLAKYGAPKSAVNFRKQVEDLKSLLIKLKIPQPYHFVGHSYGGGIAQAFIEIYPQLVRNIILMAPYTRPVDSQDIWIKSQIFATRLMFPFNTMTYDQCYDYYLRNLIYTTYPYAEPSIVKIPYKLESTFKLVQGIRKYLPEDMADKLPAGKVHLLVGVRDTLVLPYVLDTFWKKVNAKARMSRLFLQDTNHYINDTAPKFSASWIAQIVMGNGLLYKGYDFVGYPKLGYAQSVAGAKIPLEKE